MAMSDRFYGAGWRAVAALALPYRRQFLVVAAFALLATASDLLAPLIYREAVNDIAGLFVGAAPTPGVGALLEMVEPDDPGTLPETVVADAAPAPEPAAAKGAAGGAVQAASEPIGLEFSM